MAQTRAPMDVTPKERLVLI